MGVHAGRSVEPHAGGRRGRRGGGDEEEDEDNNDDRDTKLFHMSIILKLMRAPRQHKTMQKQFLFCFFK